jgi:alkylation response protein AidB-like acyl-CoA dehydrogenase
MQIALTEEQDMLRDMARSALAREAAPALVRRWADARSTQEYDAFIDAQCWAGIGWPEDQGGQGGKLLEQTLIVEEMGRAAAPSGGLLTTYGMVMPLLRAALQHSPGNALLAALGAEPEATAVALPMSAAGDQWLKQQQVTKSGDDRLSGKVPMVMHASAAQWLLVPVWEGEFTTLWRVQRDHGGVELSPRLLLDRTRTFADLSLDNVDAELIGSLRSTQLESVQARMALLLAAESLGLARRMLEIAVDYVTQRVQFGVPVGSFQAVKHCAADMLVDIEAVHSGVYYAAWALDEEEPDAIAQAWIAKATATEAAVRCADRALTLHGAIGYTWEHDLQLYYKRAKLNLELAGSPSHYRERIAATLQLT